MVVQSTTDVMDEYSVTTEKFVAYFATATDIITVAESINSIAKETKNVVEKTTPTEFNSIVIATALSPEEVTTVTIASTPTVIGSVTKTIDFATEAEEGIVVDPSPAIDIKTVTNSVITHSETAIVFRIAAERALLFDIEEVGRKKTKSHHTIVDPNSAPMRLMIRATEPVATDPKEVVDDVSIEIAQILPSIRLISSPKEHSIP